MNTEQAEWTREKWAIEARAVRRSLATLGESVPQCLPGELEECGAPAQYHHALWAAMLKARAQLLIETNHDEPEAQHFGETVYQESLANGRRYFGLA